MIRLVQLLTTFIPLLFITTIKSDDVKLTQQAPTNAEPGTEFVVEIKIEKGGIEGFAKFQEELPPGFEAEQINLKGATFTFDQNTIKIIWLSLPPENEFVITYKIKVLNNAPPQLNLGGKFSYLQDNNRMVAEVTRSLISIGSQAITENKPEPPKPAVASVSRKITLQNDGSLLVELEINQERVTGFAKIEELVPMGLESTSNLTQGSVFTFVKNKAKFVWMNCPEDQTFKVSYILTSNTNLPINFNEIMGDFSFLDQGETKKVEIIGLPENYPKTAPNVEPIAEAKPTIAETKTTDTKKEKESKKEKKQPKETNDNNTTKTESEKTEAATPINIPQPETGISYRVQISAGKRIVEQNYFKRVHNFEAEYLTENHEGWVKYTTGSFDAYRQARDLRENFNNQYNFPGPFVAAYNNGQRITVQEALMISNQKWVK